VAIYCIDKFTTYAL